MAVLNKVVIELCVMQFWSEIILVISNRTRTILKSCVGFQTKLHSTQFNYHYKIIIKNSSLIPSDDLHEYVI